MAVKQLHCNVMKVKKYITILITGVEPLYYSFLTRKGFLKKKHSCGLIFVQTVLYTNSLNTYHFINMYKHLYLYMSSGNYIWSNDYEFTC